MPNVAMECLLEQMRDNPGSVSCSAGSGAAAWALVEIERLRAILTKAAEQFELYEAQHRAKNTVESIAKADVNASMARLCRE